MKSGEIGNVDPREIAQKLKDLKYDVWLDDDRLGKQGLFVDIAEGLRHTKLVIAFMSEEYAQSPNCVMEFTHAMKNMQLPVIVCVVGLPKKQEWYRTQVGMLAANCDSVYMRDDQEFQATFEILQTRIRNVLEHPTSKANIVEDSASYITRLTREVQQKIEDLQRGFLFEILSVDKQADFPRVLSLRSDVEEGFPKLRFLCEHPGEWHFAGEKKFEIVDWNSFVNSFGGILLPLSQILRLCAISTIDCSKLSKVGENETIPKEKTIQKLKFYFKKMMQVTAVTVETVERCLENLSRVALPTGEVQWLCEHHRLMHVK